MLVKGAAALHTCRKERNNYELIAAECFWLVHHNDSSRWSAISCPPPICCLSFSFLGGVAKEYIPKLGCEKYFSQGHILSIGGDALRGVRSFQLLRNGCKNLTPLTPGDLCMFRFMITFVLCFTMGKAHSQCVDIPKMWSQTSLSYTPYFENVPT